jgi:type I restriction-modification system DNA methylase subunit
MLNQKTYSCGICNTTPDQLSHHKSHIQTQKHKDKRELFEFKLSKLSNTELEQTYNTVNINDIITETETILYSNKKLNTINNTIPIHYMASLSDHSLSVTNKEALRDKVHEIHNYLRNHGAGYGMNALKVFNILYGLKKIEENGLLDTVGLKKPDCEFSYLLSLAKEDEDEKLASLIFTHVLDSISDSKIKELLFYEIPKNIRGSVLSYLIKEIDKITSIETTCNVLLSGKIYEYFIGRDETAISELGAYFTDRHIVDYTLHKLNPMIETDGTIPSMIDMFGGSGGFTTGYINHLIEKYPQMINWNTEINKISHFDMNEDVIKSAGLEFFCLTGVLPNMDTLKYKNSFTDEFNDQKYKFVLTNPPYGGDKSNKSDAQLKRDKLKEYIKVELATSDEVVRIRRQKQLKTIEMQEKQEKKEQDKTKVSLSTCSARIQKFAKDNKLKGNDKESCSLMLLMDIVDVDGTVIGVLKEGVFFNKTYKDLRKCLVENYNVREIISVPQDQFENTSTKTSIVIFDNREQKTTEVKFSDLVVERYTEDKFVEINGDIVLLENKDDIIKCTDMLVSTANKDEILSNPICSLNGKDYHKKELVVGDGYKLVKLGDICDFIPKSKRNASFGNVSGKFNFYTSSEKVQKCDEADYKEECLIIGSGGIANIKLDNHFSCSADNLLLKSTYNLYLYSLFIGRMKLLSDGFNGSTLKHLSLEYLKNLRIPLPISDKKLQEWVNKISVPYNEKNEKQIKIKEMELFVQKRIKEIEEHEDCDEVNLGSLCEFNSGKFNTCDMDNNGPYLFYNATINSIGCHSNYCFDGEKYLLLIKSGNVKADGLGSVTKLYGKTACVIDTVQIISSININYMYGMLTLLKNKIRKTSNASVGLGHLKMSEIKLMKIKIPKNKQIIQDMEPMFQHIETLYQDIKKSEILYTQYIHELSQEAMPSSK